MVINIVNIKILFIIIGIVYTSPINLNCVLLVVVKYILYSYRGKFNISKLYYKATLSLIKLSSTLKSIKHLAFLSPICISIFKHYL